VLQRVWTLGGFVCSCEAQTSRSWCSLQISLNCGESLCNFIQEITRSVTDFFTAVSPEMVKHECFVVAEPLKQQKLLY